MQDVSVEYQEQIRQPVRNRSYMKISLDVANPNIKYNTDVTAPEGVIFSNKDSILIPFTLKPRYPTLEQNRIVLDGTATLPSKTGSYAKQGYLAENISDEAGVITDVIMDFKFIDNYFGFKGITFTFDTEYNTLPKSVHMIAYADDVVIGETTDTPNKALNWILDTEILTADRVIITFSGVDTPYSRFRLEHILFGTRYEFDSNVITNSNWKRSIDLVNSKLPTYEFDFTILDMDREYDPENPKGIYRQISDGQLVTFDYGYELNDGSIEWINGGEMYTTGETKIETQTKLPYITFKTNSILNRMTTIYNKGVYNSTPVSLYDLAEELFVFADIPTTSEGLQAWRIDESLQNIYTRSPLPKKPVNELLQIIANASRCILQVDRKGMITISPEPTTITNGKLTLSDDYSSPKVSKYPPLQGVDTSVNIVTPSTEISKLLEKDISSPTAEYYEFEYTDSTNISATTSGTLQIIGTPEYYSHYCKIQLKGAGKLIINGNKLEIGSLIITHENELIGARCPSYNELLTDESDTRKYAEWIKNYAIRSNDYEIENRGFPEMDMDNIIFDTAISTGNYGTIYYMEINFDGTISGKTKVLTASKTFNNLFDATGTFNAGQLFRLPSMMNS